MSLPTTYELEQELLPEIRSQIGGIADERTRQALFSLLGLVHDLAAELAHEREWQR